MNSIKGLVLSFVKVRGMFYEKIGHKIKGLIITKQNYGVLSFYMSKDFMVSLNIEDSS